MAEFPNLGKRCEFNSCGSLDFLPFVCDFCKKIYCLEHRQVAEHDCTDFKSHGFSSVNKGIPSVGHKKQNCSLRGCGNCELVKIQCKHCQENFCLQHRHQQDHSCSALNSTKDREESKTAALVRRILGTKESTDEKKRTPQRTKSSKTSSLVNLMKIKLKARGDPGLAQCERIHLSVDLCGGTDGTVTTKPFYFSKSWTIGRVIDNLASMEKLKNENNVANATKLMLCKSVCTNPLTMDSTLDDLVKTNVLCDGDSVILRYER